MLFSTPIFSSWMTIVMPWAFGGTRMALDHSIEQVHIKFCKQTLKVPWYTENKTCRAELGRYPLSIDLKACLLCYWQRLEQKSDSSPKEIFGSRGGPASDKIAISLRAASQILNKTKDFFESLKYYWRI